MTQTDKEDPHRHDFHQILFFRAGGGWHLIEGQPYPMASGMLHLVARGQIHGFLEAQAVSGDVVCFHDELLADLYGDTQHHLLFHTLFLSAPPYRSTLLDPTLQALIRQLFPVLLAEEERYRHTGDVAVIRSLIAALLHALRRFFEMQPSLLPPCPDADDLVVQFLRLLERSFRQHHDVAFYAGELACSPEHLARVLTRRLQRTPKQVIRERVLLEARRYLRYSRLSVKEIAATLGFAAPAHFSRAFKQEQGLAPDYFRANSGMAKPSPTGLQKLS